MLRSIALAAICVLATGCASIINDSTHPMRVEVADAGGTAVPGADCVLTNDYGPSTMKSGNTTQVRRSSKDLDIVCTHPSNPNATGRAISRGNVGFAGNILIGGVIGAVIDHNKGTAYTYPTWVRMVFGKTLVFDRSAERDGQPLLGTELEILK